jgi:hypothetical protein
VSLYLSEGNALLSSPSNRQDQSAAIAYDPRNPSPSYGGARFNPFDASVVPGPLDIHTVVESRSDALVFSTPELDTELKITGPVEVLLYVSSDRADTDFSIRLCDVYPDGRSMIMTDGIRRLRFRNGFASEEPALPGTVYPLRIQLQNLALTLLKGHRLRIVVSCSDYPRFDANLNNGGAMYAAGDTLVANNKVFFDVNRPSRVDILTDARQTGVHSEPAPVAACELAQNYPNPVFTGTTLSYRLSFPSFVTLKLYTIYGREVAVLAEELKNSGSHTVHISTAALPAGMYYYTLTTSTASISKTMTVVK